MNRIFTALLLAALSFTASAEVWQARYGVAETFDFKLYNADGTLDVDEADGGTEVSLSCNEGAETTATNDFVDEGTFYSIALTAAELQCERVAVVVAATTTEVFFIQTHSNASAMTPQSDANVTQFGGSAGAFASGIPSVNATQISGDSAAADELELAYDGATGAVESMGILRQGTAQSATGTTLVLDSSASFADDVPIGMTLVACGSTQGYCQARPITDYVSSTDTATVTAWQVTPSGTITFYLFGTASSSGSVTIGTGGISAASFAAGAIDAAAIGTGAIDADAIAADSIGASELAADAIGASEVATDAIGAAEIAANALTTAEIATGAISSDEVADGAIDAGAFAADAITAAKLASDAGTEVAAAVTTAQGSLTGTCDSGSTTTCVDNALTQADASQLEDRLICFDDSWCALITTFTPGSDTATTTKVAPSTRASKAYTIFPATLE